MPTNRNALIRYRTIDNCLRNRQRRWTLQDLVDKCSDALYEFEGIDKGVSTRTIQVDIQMMRSEKLGYNAPIVVVNKRYYTYADDKYSITNVPLTAQDMNMLTEAVLLLKQFKDFSRFGELSSIVSKLESQVYSQRHNLPPVIDFEKNENLKGLEFLDPIYQAIINRHVILLTYQPFKAPEPSLLKLHPWLLKEFRNRWFLFGVLEEGGRLLNFALDRIQQIELLQEAPYYKDEKFDPSIYFKDIVGVSLYDQEPVQEVILFVEANNAPYVLTKPFHHSQKVLEQTENGILISINVRINFELERDLLGMGETITIVSPQVLRENIKRRVESSLKNYSFPMLNPDEI